MALRVAWFALVFLLIVASLLSSRVGRPLYPLVWIFAGYASFIALLTATNEATISSNVLLGSQFILLLGCGVFVFTANAVSDPRFVVRVSVSFLIGQTLSSLAGVAQLLGASFLGYESVLGRSPGLGRHPNTLGIMACIAVLLCLYFVVNNVRWRPLAIGVLAINLAGIFATGSISAMLALSVGVFVQLVALRGRLLKYSLVGLVVISFAWLFVSVTNIGGEFLSPRQRYLQVTGQTDGESSWESRQRTYAFAWEHIKAQPVFGNGLANEFGGTFNGSTVTHNIFLRAWYQGGFLLAISIAIILIVSIVVAFRAMATRRHVVEASILAGVLTFALTSAFFEQVDYWLPLLVAWASISSRLSLDYKQTPVALISSFVPVEQRSRQLQAGF